MNEENFNDYSEVVEVSTPKLEYENGLREDLLGEILNDILPEGEWIHNKSFKLDEFDKEFHNLKRVIPDYRNEYYRMIVEFDGDGGVRRGHYSDASTCMRDLRKYCLFTDLGYKYIAIPPYVQLNKETIKYYFRVDTDKEYYNTCNNHGFLHHSITLPSNFCSLGIRRFKDEFWSLPESIRNKIRSSITDRIKILIKGGYSEPIARLMVLPSELDYIMYPELDNKYATNSEYYYNGQD